MRRKSVLRALVVLMAGSGQMGVSGFVAPSARERASIVCGSKQLQETAIRLVQGDEIIETDAAQDEQAAQDGGSRRGLLVGSISVLVAAAASASSSVTPLMAQAASGASMSSTQQGLPSRRVGGLVAKIRGMGDTMDELQRDLMQERWDLVEAYPAQLRSFVPMFTTYTDSAFPSDAPTDKGLRVALRYEVGRFFASLEKFKQAVSRKSLDEAYIAYSEMSLHFDRYMRVGGLYTYYDNTISTEPYFQGISESTLVYADPRKDPPLVRDLVIIIKGPDKGKTGIITGIYTDGSGKCVVKLDRYKGMREVRLIQTAWVAKRLGEQDPDDVFLIPRK